MTQKKWVNTNKQGDHKWKARYILVPTTLEDKPNQILWNLCYNVFMVAEREWNTDKHKHLLNHIVNNCNMSPACPFIVINWLATSSPHYATFTSETSINHCGLGFIQVSLADELMPHLIHARVQISFQVCKVKRTIWENNLCIDYKLHFYGLKALSWFVFISHH